MRYIMKRTFFLPILTGSLVAILAACSGAQNSSIENTTAPATETVAEISTDTPVAVSWKMCVPEGTFPNSTAPSNTDEAGCRHNTAPMNVWPKADGTVEVLWVRKRAGAFGRQSTKPYVLMTVSRGCDPNGPGVEGHYEAGESVFIDAEWANDEPIIEVTDVVLAPVSNTEDGSDAGMLVFEGGDCEAIDLEKDSY